MALQLANNEKILKSYEYSKSTGKTGLFKKEESSSTLIVTNKRIVSEYACDTGVSRSEIPIKSADYIGTNFSKKTPSLILGIVLAVLGLILAIVLAIVMLPLLVIGVAVLICGVVIIIKAVTGKSASVTVQISSYHGEHSLMSIGSSVGTFNSAVKSMKIFVNVDTAIQMVDEIGAIIMGVKDGTIY